MNWSKDARTPGSILQGIIPFAMNHNIIELEGIRMHYAEMGSGVPVIMVHGFGSCFYTWRHYMQALSDDFRVIAPDLPGFGFSDDLPDQDYSLKRYIFFLEAIREAYDAEHIHLVGHSFGGLVCLAYAATRPKYTISLVLISTAVPGSVHAPEGALKNLMLFGYDSKDTLTEDVFSVYAAARCRTPESLQSQAAFPDLEGREGALRDIPALAIWGARDVITPITNLAYLERLIRNIKCVTFETRSHMIHEEKNAELMPLVSGFLHKTQEKVKSSALR